MNYDVMRLDKDELESLVTDIQKFMSAMGISHSDAIDKLTECMWNIIESEESSNPISKGRNE